MQTVAVNAPNQSILFLIRFRYLNLGLYSSRSKSILSLSEIHSEIFVEQALPEVCGGSLADKSVLDVGSRLGAAVYAAVVLGRCKAAVGIEMNAELCALQEEALTLFGLKQRGASVVCADVMTRGEDVAAADVVVLHSAFQFFQSPAQSRAIWDFMRRQVPPRTASRRGARGAHAAGGSDACRRLTKPAPSRASRGGGGAGGDLRPVGAAGLQ